MISAKIQQILLDRGIHIGRHPGLFSLFELKLKAAKARGLEIKSVIDGGAAEGAWTRELKEVYPDAQVLCVEPRGGAQPNLNALAGELGGIQIAQTLLGPSEGDAQFNESFDHSSVLPNAAGQSFGNTSTMPMTTLDSLIAKQKFPWPDLIKLDLQGYEMDALRGATEALKHAQSMLLELSFHRFQKGAPLAGEMIGFLGERGFRVYDIPGLWSRPLDGALAQGDFLFLKNDHKLFADERWSAESNVP